MGLIERLDNAILARIEPSGDGPRKFDHGKIRLELVPPELVLGAGRGLTYGAIKYAPGNWATPPGFDWSRPYGALQRHLVAWQGGEDFDIGEGGSNLHHLDLAACELAFLMAHVARGLGKDDRKLVGVAP